MMIVDNGNVKKEARLKRIFTKNGDFIENLNSVLVQFKFNSRSVLDQF